MTESTLDQSLTELASRYSPVQRRTLEVALDLFAAHGVGGTSLQMIADALGVTKAAVYYQFSTKEAILIGVLEVNLAPLEVALAEAGGAPADQAGRDLLLQRVVKQVVGQRRAIRTLQNDPLLLHQLNTYEPSRRLWARLFAGLLGTGSGARTRTRAALLSAIIGSVGHPFVADLPDAAVRDEILRAARLVMGQPL